MGTITYGMLVSLDGYVSGLPDGPEPPMFGEDLHWYFNALMKQTAMALYGRHMYETMRYWDTAGTDPESTAVERDFAQAWRSVPKVVVSTTLREVGDNARLVSNDVEQAVRALKAQTDGEIEVAGPTLAATLSKAGLIDEYRLYLRPGIHGGGKPFFAGGVPLDLKLLGTETLPSDTALVRYGRAN